ncbi:MAG: hypothetical protein WC516_09910 [Patescibacteria group bacterium]
MTLGTVLKVIQLLLQVIDAAMKTFETLTEKGSGKTKKELCMMIAKDALGDEAYAKFEGLISVLINIKALLSFGSTGDNPT